MKRTLILAMLLNGASLRAEVPPDWSTNFPAVLADARARQSPVLVYFTASWCGPCKLMARTTLTNDAVTAVLASVQHVALDIDQFPELASQHHISAVPTFEMLTASGAEAGRVTGYQSAEDFVPWLTNGITEAGAAFVREQRLAAQLKNIDQWLMATNRFALAAAVTNLFDLCAERDPGLVREAVDRLKIVAEREPEVLFPGLMDRRLAIRIQTANVLRAKLGESFAVDPWSPAAARAASLTGWRQQLLP